MDAKDILIQMKQVFNSFVAPAPVAPVAPAALAAPQYTLQDGTPVNISNLQPGGTVTLVTPSGETPAPAGEHCLSDGTCIVVAEGGIISEVKPAMAPGMAPGMAPEEPAAQEDMKKKLEDMQAAYNALSARFTEMETKFSSLQTGTADGFSKVLEFCEAVSQEPVAKADPIVTPKKPHVFVEQEESTADKFAGMAKTLFSKK